MTPVSRLISQHQVCGGCVGGGVSSFAQSSSVCFLLEMRRGGGKCRKGGEKAKFVHWAGKLISKVKRKECVPLKNEKEWICFRALFKQHTPEHVSLPPEANGSDAFCHPKKTDLLREELRCVTAELCEPTLPPCGGSWHFIDTRDRWWCMKAFLLLKIALSSQLLLPAFTGPLYLHT